MDVDFLISEVYGRPSLWDQKDINHHNRFVLDKLWNQVAVRLNSTSILVRKKWKTLRDKFRSIISSIPKPKLRNVQSYDYKGEWKYFNKLLFLSDQFTDKNLCDNITENNANKNEFEESINNDDNDSISDISIQERHINESSETISNYPRTSQSSSHVAGNKRNISDTLMQVGKEEFQFLQAKRPRVIEDDEDLNFFKSLLPHVKTLSACDKMDYRIKVLQITRDYLKANQRTATDSRTDKRILTNRSKSIDEASQTPTLSDCEVKTEELSENEDT